MLATLRRHRALALAFAAALALALWLLVEVASGLLAWAPPEREPIRPWMTVGYVGRSWGVPPRAIDALTGLPTPQEAGRPLTLSESAARRGVPVEQVIAEVEAAIEALRAGEGPTGQAPGHGPGRGAHGAGAGGEGGPDEGAGP